MTRPLEERGRARAVPCGLARCGVATCLWETQGGDSGTQVCPVGLAHRLGASREETGRMVRRTLESRVSHFPGSSAGDNSSRSLGIGLAPAKLVRCPDIANAQHSGTKCHLHHIHGDCRRSQPSLLAGGREGRLSAAGLQAAEGRADHPGRNTVAGGGLISLVICQWLS